MNLSNSEPVPCWENELGSDEWAYTIAGETVGAVKPVGGSFACIYKNSPIAFRPDLRSAQTAVAKYHQLQVSAAAGHVELKEPNDGR